MNVCTVPKNTLYFSFPFLNSSTTVMTRSLRKYLSQHYPHINFQFTYNTPFKISSFFRYKPSFSSLLSASVVYKFTCPLCNKGYIGSTTRLLRTRICEHQGISFRTSLPLSSPPFSNIRNHTLSCHFLPLPKHFSVLDTHSDPVSLRILESLYIHNHKPQLNSNLSSCALHIVQS